MRKVPAGHAPAAPQNGAMTTGRSRRRLVGFHAAVLAPALALAMLGSASPASAQPRDRAFERDLYQTRIEHEVKFRAAAIQVAWAAEALCDATTQIEPFVLLSTHAIRKRLPDADMALFTEVTGVDDKWRVVWVDEGAPDDLKLRDVVTHVNGRALPAGGTKFEFGALLRGGSVVSNDDQGFWDAMLAARADAKAGKPMTVRLADGRELTVETQKGCAGSVTASAFDNDPDTFWRQGNLRAKIPANAMIEARDSDEFRWLAAFGTYFQASQSAIAASQRSEGVSNGFVVGRILTFAIPGANKLLAAAQGQAERAIAVDSVVANADLFANEVVASLGGDPGAGLRLSERMRALGMKVDVVMMDDFRRSNSAEHATRVRAIQAAQLERERAEARAAEDAQRAPVAAPR